MTNSAHEAATSTNAASQANQGHSLKSTFIKEPQMNERKKEVGIHLVEPGATEAK